MSLSHFEKAGKEISMFGQVGAHNLAPFNPLPDNMFPNSKIVNEKKALRVHSVGTRPSAFGKKPEDDGHFLGR